MRPKPDQRSGLAEVSASRINAEEHTEEEGRPFGEKGAKYFYMQPFKYFQERSLDLSTWTRATRLLLTWFAASRN